MDRILIHNLEFFASIGVTSAEREVGQRLRLSLEARLDLSTAGASDSLADTVSYAEMAEMVESIGRTTRCQLLEHLAERMASELLAHFPIDSVRLRLMKRPPPVALALEEAGVEIVRTRGG